MYIGEFEGSPTEGCKKLKIGELFRQKSWKGGKFGWTQLLLPPRCAPQIYLNENVQHFGRSAEILL